MERGFSFGRKIFSIVLFFLFAIEPCAAAWQELPRADQSSEAGKSDPEEYAKAIFLSHWRKSGDSWFMYLTSDQGKQLFQVDQPKISITSEPLSREDQSRQITWKGSCSFNWASLRVFFPDRGWIRFNKEGAEVFSMERTGEGWRIKSVTAPFYSIYNPDILKELGRFELPTEEDVASALTKSEITDITPPMIAELNPSLFSNLFQKVRPKILGMKYPKYTPEARHNNINGRITLRTEFRADGKIGRVILFRGLGYGLDENSIEAARKIQFEPARIDGTPVTVWAKVEFTFQLDPRIIIP